MTDKQLLGVLRLDQDAVTPTRVHDDDAGLDLYSLEGFAIAPRQSRVTRTGIALAIPVGHVGIITDRSSVAMKGLKVAGGIIDAGYRGEVHVILWNISMDHVSFARGERIAQLLIVPITTPLVQEVESLGSTPRGAKGFGSSGR